MKGRGVTWTALLAPSASSGLIWAEWVSRRDVAPSDWCRRIALVNEIWFKVFGCDRANRENGVCVDGNSWADRGLRSNPCAVFYRDRSVTVGHGVNGVVVVSCEEHCALRHANIVTDMDLVDVVNPTVFANPAVVANGEIPRGFDVDIVLYNQSFADMGAE